VPGGLPLGPARARRVALVLLDAFGLAFRRRFAAHPFLQRLDAAGWTAPLTSQFPSTTTAHVTTVHTGLGVGEHGLYEWNVLDPATGEVVVPLLACVAGDAPGTLGPARLRAMLPGPSRYERLASHGVRARVRQPARFSPSPFDRVAASGAELVPFASLEAGLAGLAGALAEPGGPALEYLYWDAIDAVGHEHGPGSSAFAAAAVRALDALEAFAGSVTADDAVLLVTADHGQVAVDPARVDLLDAIWPELSAHLRLPRPAGSARDVFLHVRPGAADAVVAELGARLEGRATVHATAGLVTAGLFGEAGPRLRARLGEVCVLPAPGRMAWLSSVPGPERHFRGHHGGLTPAEAETWVGVLALPS
jgi:hypothetical protein